MEKSVSAVQESVAIHRPRCAAARRRAAAVICTLLLLPALYLNLNSLVSWIHPAAPPFAHLSAHCAHIPPIAAPAFHQRQRALAATLHALNASVYIAEPGASAQYYANISGRSWHLSERPLLLLVAPRVSADGTVEPRIAVLTPTFEATRARLLPVPAEGAVVYPEWPEDVDPYQVAVDALGVGDGTIFVDGSVRHFVVDGLAAAAPSARVLSAPVEIRQLRERKSAEELEIMRCANEVTVLAIRAVREQLYIGVRESEAHALMDEALAAAGLEGGSSLVLFGENAALPHGSGTDRALGPHDFVLIDCGGSLHGYVSDVTRTFLLPDSSASTRHLALWHLVHVAQARALQAAQAGVVASSVDAAARELLKTSGNGQYFTHRLGHGIGLEGHESPYLRGGSKDVIQTGHTFSDEPGIYIEGEVGVRIEDCIYIDEEGRAVYLTEGVGAPTQSPWAP
ncbi:peptidase M24 [Artomyces pyxidatus]|uniref:Peptidase M24 n=1 Tax=Artomyces pyxidatus TaxID=48021 RepID=A0ACB8T3Y1_9AGAM|nr:peptidase M24 [Artomyces pyxidatus]